MGCLLVFFVGLVGLILVGGNSNQGNWIWGSSWWLEMVAMGLDLGLFLVAINGSKWWVRSAGFGALHGGWKWQQRGGGLSLLVSCCVGAGV